MNGDQDCVRLRISKSGLDDFSCSQAYCPLCKMSVKAKFHLQGVCSDSSADSFYLLKSGGWFEGYIQSMLVYSEALARWEITDRITGEAVASLNSSSDYPLGVHDWVFLPTSSSPACSDRPSSDHRRLNLHAAVDQPGSFCCDDGACIGSEQRCDNNPQCQDATDERDCQVSMVKVYFVILYLKVIDGSNTSSPLR